MNKVTKIPSKDLKGQRFGTWKVVSFAGKSKRKAYWNVICDCGNARKTQGGHLINGSSSSSTILVELQVRGPSSNHESRGAIMTHSPGPWVAVKHPESGYDIDHVATGHGIVTDSGVEKESDAHLIAAAPDLLEACMKLSMVAEEVTAGKYSQDVIDWASAIADFAKASINKARGE